MSSRFKLFLGSSLVSAALAASLSLGAEHSSPSDAPDTKISVVPEPTESPRYLHDESKVTQGSITIGGHALGYQAEAGVLVVHVKDPMDDDAPPPHDDKSGAPPPQPPEAGMSYVAYFRGDKEDTHRPITFLYNGGPGSSTVWLHMGAFGPKRVVTADDSHSPAAPYQLIDNDESLLDVSALVFIDAPGTGFSRVAGKDKEKAFYGIDPDAHAFAEFITGFLSKWGRWNSPKYIFGESYGTTRAANVVNLLETQSSVDVNGVILLSQCLNYDVLPDYPELKPAVDQPYELWLPSYAATAWYHHRLPEAPRDLASLVDEVEHFASGEYALALQAGATLDPAVAH